MPFDCNDLDGLDGLHLGFRDFGLMATGFAPVKRRFPKCGSGSEIVFSASDLTGFQTS
jgi:hypothetical protein